MESYQAANVIFVAIILWTAIKNSGKTIPEKMICTTNMICTPNTGHPVLGVFLCDTVMNTRRCASNYIDKENGSRHQKE